MSPKARLAVSLRRDVPRLAASPSRFSSPRVPPAADAVSKRGGGFSDESKVGYSSGHSRTGGGSASWCVGGHVSDAAASRLGSGVRTTIAWLGVGRVVRGAAMGRASLGGMGPGPAMRQGAWRACKALVGPRKRVLAGPSRAVPHSRTRRPCSCADARSRRTGVSCERAHIRPCRPGSADMSPCRRASVCEHARRARGDRHRDRHGESVCCEATQTGVGVGRLRTSRAPVTGRRRRESCESKEATQTGAGVGRGGGLAGLSGAAASARSRRAWLRLGAPTADVRRRREA